MLAGGAVWAVVGWIAAWAQNASPLLQAQIAGLFLLVGVLTVGRLIESADRSTGRRLSAVEREDVEHARRLAGTLWDLMKTYRPIRQEHMSECSDYLANLEALRGRLARFEELRRALSGVHMYSTLLYRRARITPEQRRTLDGHDVYKGDDELLRDLARAWDRVKAESESVLARR